jgi:hypothetical protein
MFTTKKRSLRKSPFWLAFPVMFIQRPLAANHLAERMPPLGYLPLSQLGEVRRHPPGLGLG